MSPRVAVATCSDPDIDLDTPQTLAALRAAGEDPVRIGFVDAAPTGEPQVRYTGTLSL